MSLRARQQNQLGLASATSAQNAVRTSTIINMNKIQPGTLLAEIAGSTITSTVVPTYKWFGSQDGTNYFEVKDVTNATQVARAAGTGSGVAYADAQVAPMALSAYTYAKMTATLTVAATAAGDVTAVTFRFLGLGAY